MGSALHFSGLVLASALGFALAGPAGNTNEDLRVQFQSAAPLKWEEYLEFARCLQGTATTSRNSVTNYSAFKSRWLWKQAPSSALYQSQRIEPEYGGGDVVATNPDYAFRLKRKSERDPWVLTAFTAGTDARDVDTDDEAQRRATGRLLQLYLRWLPDLVKEAEFHVSSVSAINIGSESMVRVDFRYRPRNPRNNPALVGWMALDPARYWILRQYELMAEFPDGKNKIRHRNEFKDGHRGHPIIVRSFEQGDGIEGGVLPRGWEQVTEWNISEVPGGAPKEAFRLSAFGLPEPVGLESPKGTPNYVWLLIGVVICATLAVGFRYLSRRRRAVA